MRKALVLIHLFLLYSLSAVYPVTISQIDTSKLLVNQDIKLYVSVMENQQPVKNLTIDNFKIFEAPTNVSKFYKEVPIVDFKAGAN